MSTHRNRVVTHHLFRRTAEAKREQIMAWQALALRTADPKAITGLEAKGIGTTDRLRIGRASARRYREALATD